MPDVSVIGDITEEFTHDIRFKLAFWTWHFDTLSESLS